MIQQETSVKKRLPWSLRPSTQMSDLLTWLAFIHICRVGHRQG